MDDPDIEASEPNKDGEIEIFEDPAQIKSCFVGHGVFSACQHCKSTIEAGIMYYGCHKEQSKWTAAGQELSFHHFMGNCVVLAPAFDDDENFPGFISRPWAEQALNPHHVIPGSDLGVTELVYGRVLDHCGILAAFMINDLYLTETGRLYQRDARNKSSIICNLSERVSQQPENPKLRDYWAKQVSEREKQTSVYKEIVD